VTISSVRAGIGDEARRPRDADALARALREAREYTLSIYAHLSAAQRAFPCIAEVNPPGWELAHIGWFQEFWCRRHTFDDPAGARRPSRIEYADAWWNSARVAHDARWSLPLPDWDAVHAYLAATLADTLEALAASRDDRYAFELALYHEDMHGEALVMSLQTLALPAPPRLASRTWAATPARGDVAHAGGSFMQGAQRGDERERFVFDNEKWAHEVRVRPFAIARSPVTCGDFAAFVDDGGYERESLWPGAAGDWRSGAARRLPAYWRRAANGFEVRRFDRWHAIDEHAPVAHVNAYEAEAFCRWAGRRLPSESEWEYARSTDPVPMPGHAWQWTSTSFDAYPGFAADRYAEYSEPWFRSHRVLRGGSWATRPRLVHERFRNFYLPARHDPIAGFMTCARE
jgi:gamma-glutamyl hercynylcysteine S-oxide synthase